MNMNVVFSRQLLSSVHRDVKKAFPDIKNPMKAAYVHKCRSFKNTWEFYGPENFYYSMTADNAYDARAAGWDAYMRHKGVEVAE